MNEKNIQPHKLGKTELTQIIKRIQYAARYSKMQDMSVSNICVPGNKPVTFEDGSPVLENNVSDFIRERLRIYNESWITSILDEVVEDLVASIYGSGTGRI